MRKTRFGVCAFLLILLLIPITGGCSIPAVSSADAGNEGAMIVKHPLPLDLGRGKLTVFPSYDQYSAMPLQVDLRGYDTTDVNLSNRLNDLMHADFDTRTIWPYRLPKPFNPKLIMEYGKNPGLGIRSLNKQGVDGRGISIAIIDQALLVEHVEYKDRLRHYEEIHCLDKTAAENGTAAASIAAGKTVGVAPAANLYYLAVTGGAYKSDTFEKDLSLIADAINRVSQINTALPEPDKIRVLAVDTVWTEDDKGFEIVIKSIENAEKQGIFVISPSIYDASRRKYYFNGLGRDPLTDPDTFSSYRPGLRWEQEFYFYDSSIPLNDVLFIPMDSRCTASPSGKNAYAYYLTGGASMSAPYLAAVYALCCQVKRDITPDVFWQQALKTGETVVCKKNYFQRNLKKVINPVKLINSLKYIK